MHSLLEGYLKEVAEHLAGLPSARRAEELREVRTHLENAVIVGRELGQSEDEAERDVLRQFGTPGELSENLVWAWRRGRAAQRRDFWGAAACAVAVTILTNHLPLWIESRLLPNPGRGFLQPPFSVLFWLAWAIWLTPMFLLVGGISGLLFPKRAVVGVVAGLMLFHTYFFVINLAHDSTAQIFHQGRSLMLFGMDIVFVAVSVAAAWAVSRLRMAGQRREYRTAAK